MAFFLIAPGKTLKVEMAFGLAAVWAHPRQARLSSLDDAVNQLTLLIDVGDNWAYAFVWFSEDAQHVPLSNEGHLSTMVNGALCRSRCGHLGQLEVCKLLQYGDQVVYPERLNGGLEPMQSLLSGPPLQGLYVFGNTTCELSFLLVDLSQVTLGDRMPKAPAINRTSTPSSPSYLTMEPPLKQIATSALLLRSKSFYHMLCWTPPVRHCGTPPQRSQHLWPWGLHPPPEQNSSSLSSDVTTGGHTCQHHAN